MFRMLPGNSAQRFVGIPSYSLHFALYKQAGINGYFHLTALQTQFLR